MSSSTISKLAGALIASVSLFTLGALLAPSIRADTNSEAKPDAKTEAKTDAKTDEVPTLKKKTTSAGPIIGGYLGYREIQAELKLTQEEKQKIADAQKWHRQEEEKLYVEYEKKIRELLGDDRWRLLAKLVEKKREESSTKKKSKTTSESAKPEEKPAEKPASEKSERDRERP